MIAVSRFFATLVLLLVFGSAAEAGPQARLDSGAIEGGTEDGVNVFRGIPYAAPPVGGLRWRPPQPVPRWTGVRQATAFGPDCPQRPMTNVPGPGFVNPTSEDCLTLNVWAPPGGRKLPVMVWIYGGAFIMGAGSYPTYDGANFARQGVVLVTFNYRVGILGFFAHPALTREGGPVGNYGFMDQIAALQWVRRNIASFGGDPTNVTIFGESAGGESVNALLVSAPARGLFAKAISESGGGRSQGGILSWPSLSYAEASGAVWAAANGAAGGDAKSLRAIPLAALLKASDGPDFPHPIIDGQIVPARVDRAMADGRQAVVPYMVGANSYEESLLQWLPGVAEAYAGKLGPAGEAALRLYRQGAPDESAAERKLWGDAVMVAPARALARGMSAAGAPTYLYHFAYVPKAMRGKTPGVPHSGEMNFVFDNLARVSTFGETAADAPMAALTHAYWVAFARTGNPNGGGRPEWPAYTAANDTLLLFSNDGAGPVRSFEKDRLDLLDALYGKPQ